MESSVRLISFRCPLGLQTLICVGSLEYCEGFGWDIYLSKHSRNNVKPCNLMSVAGKEERSEFCFLGCSNI